MALSREAVAGIADYARIALTEQELDEMTTYMNEAVELLAPIREYDLEGVEPGRDDPHEGRRRGPADGGREARAEDVAAQLGLHLRGAAVCEHGARPRQQAAPGEDGEEQGQRRWPPLREGAFGDRAGDPVGKQPRLRDQQSGRQQADGDGGDEERARRARPPQQSRVNRSGHRLSLSRASAAG